MAEGLRALGPLTVRAQPAAGPWCWAAPLWANPLLCLERPRPDVLEAMARRLDPLRGPGLRYNEPDYWVGHGFAPMAALSSLVGLRTAGDLCSAFRLVSMWEAGRRQLGLSLGTPAAGESLLQHLWGLRPARLPEGLRLSLQDPQTCAAVVRGMWLALPAPWRETLQGMELARLAGPARAAAPAGALPYSAAVRCAVGAVAWRFPEPPWLLPAPPPAPRFVGPADAAFSVRAATQLQLGDALAARHERHVAFARAALGGEPAEALVRDSCVGLQRSLKGAWRLKWENVQKETWWRLTVGGVAAAGGHGLCPGAPCTCGFQPPVPLTEPGRAACLQCHAFWAEPGPGPGICPIAAAVLGQLRLALPAGAPLTRADLWLLRAPVGGGVHPGVWRVVALAALSAMAMGRRAAWKFRCEAREARDRGGLRQASLDELWAAALRRMQADPAEAAAPAAALGGPGAPAAGPGAAAPAGPAAAAAAAAPAGPGPAAPAGPAAAAGPGGQPGPRGLAAPGPARPPPLGRRRARRFQQQQNLLHVRPEQRAARLAAADLWCRLSDFVALGTTPPDWVVAPNAPFLAAAAAAGQGPLRLRVNVPAAAAPAAAGA
jgi:hypothetical protein